MQLLHFVFTSDIRMCPIQTRFDVDTAQAGSSLSAYVDPKVTLSPKTMMAAIMLQIAANTKSGRALRAVRRRMMSMVRRISPAVRH